MLKRIRIKGYKSLEDVEVELNGLTVLVGANASGKSNFLDAVQFLSQLATSRTVEEAFDFPHRGQPLDSFAVTQDGWGKQNEKEKLAFSIEADICLSKDTINAVNKRIKTLLETDDETDNSKKVVRSAVREHNLRYRIEVEFLRNSGEVRVSDEYLAALNSRGEPKTAQNGRAPFIEKSKNRINLRMEGSGRPTFHELGLNYTILSMAQYLPQYLPRYPHLEAARSEFASWNFYYLEPRERMRTPMALKEESNIGIMGEKLSIYLYTLKESNIEKFKSLERSMQTLIPSIRSINPFRNKDNEIELRVNLEGKDYSAGVLSEGTLRLLGLLTTSGGGNNGQIPLVGFEEPENGVHPGLVSLIANFFRTQEYLGQTQYIVSTHSKELASELWENLYLVEIENGRTAIQTNKSLGPLLQYITAEKAEYLLEQQ